MHTKIIYGTATNVQNEFNEWTREKKPKILKTTFQTNEILKTNEPFVTLCIMFEFGEPNK
jgi:hypothetical protein